jgi:hypothetical protein
MLIYEKQNAEQYSTMPFETHTHMRATKTAGCGTSHRYTNLHICHKATTINSVQNTHTHSACVD